MPSRRSPLCCLFPHLLPTLGCLLSLTPLTAASETALPSPYPNGPGFAAYVEQLQEEHGFSSEQLSGWFSGVARQDRVLELIARPAEKTLEWHQYKRIFLSAERAAQGAEFWRTQADVLARMERAYGVDPAMVVAILGVETRYGKHTGIFPVLDSLATLAFDYPPRSKFFRNELTEFLLLAREEGVDPTGIKGSYAGAMGYGQFIPSSYRAYAVDFDGDQVRDIWNNAEDAIGSVANYFARHGWEPDGPVVASAVVEGGAFKAWVNEPGPPKRTVGELEAKGFVPVTQVDGGRKAKALELMGEDGPLYWTAFQNFYVITRYNRSALYAMAVHDLSEAVRAAYSNQGT